MPLWRVQLYFPQYPEGPLQVVAHAHAVTGDLGEIDMLNEYIGVKFPHDIPELKILPKLLYGAAALAGLAALVRNRLGLWLKGATIASLVASGAWMMLRIDSHLTQFGANPDPNAPLSALVEPFKPPLVGTVTLVQVKAVAGFLWGTYFLAAAGILLAAGFWLALRQQQESIKIRKQEELSHA